MIKDDSTRNNLIGVNALRPNYEGPKGPDNSAEIYCAIEQTTTGCYLSIWSKKAGVWVKLLNKYGTYAQAEAAIEGYGFTKWKGQAPPHFRNVRGMPQKSRIRGWHGR